MRIGSIRGLYYRAGRSVGELERDVKRGFLKVGFRLSQKGSFHWRMGWVVWRRRRGCRAAIARRGGPLGHAHKQDDAGVALPFLGDGDGFGDGGEALDDGVEFGRADADAADVEQGIRAAEDDDAVVLGQGGEVAVAPDAGEM